MALANTAVQLARSGHDVLMIDWDLKHPGSIGTFFAAKILKRNISRSRPHARPADYWRFFQQHASGPTDD